MANVEIVIKALDQTGQAFASVKEKTQSLQETGKKLQKVGLAMTAVGAGITAGMASAVKTFQDFEYAMKNVQVVSGATGEELQKLTEFARQMGATTKFSATEAAEAQYYLASAGMKTEEIMQTLSNVLSLAAGTQSDLAQTAEMVTATLSQFNLKAEESARVADVFMTAIANSQATMDKLAYSMRYVGPVAHSLGISLEETTSYLMALYNAGYKGEQAGTILRNAFTRLMNVSDDAAMAIQNLGLSMQDVDPSVNSFRDILDKLSQAGASTSDIIKIFGQEAGPGVAAMMSIGADAIAEYQQKLEQAGGTAEKAAKEQMNTLQGQLDMLKSAFQELQLSLAEAVIPIIKSFINKLTSLVNWFNNLPEPVKKAISAFTLFSGVGLTVGGTLSMVLGTMMRMSQTFPMLGTVAVKSFTAISTALKFLAANPQWIAISAAIFGIVEVIKLLYKHWDDVVGFINKTVKSIGDWFNGLFGFLGKGWNSLVDGIKALWNGFVEFWKNIFEVLRKIFFGWIDSIKGAFDKVIGFFKKIGEGIAGIWNKVVDGAKKMSDTLVGHSIIPDMVRDIQKEFLSMEGSAVKVADTISQTFKKNLSNLSVGSKGITTPSLRTGRSEVRNNITIQVKEVTDVSKLLKALSQGV